MSIGWPELLTIGGGLVGLWLIVVLASAAVRRFAVRAAFARIDELDEQVAAESEYAEPLGLLFDHPALAATEAARRVRNPDCASRGRLLEVLRRAPGPEARRILAEVARAAADPLAPEAWALLTLRPADEWGKAYAASDGGRDEQKFLAAAGAEPWLGWYRYAIGEEHAMRLTLKVVGGRIEGKGADDIGAFTFDGTIVEDTVEMVKRYATHTVDYHGYRRGDAVEGRWSIGIRHSGAFRLWREVRECGR